MKTLLKITESKGNISYKVCDDDDTLLMASLVGLLESQPKFRAELLWACRYILQDDDTHTKQELKDVKDLKKYLDDLNVILPS